jgi:long-subunit acyl-CoA synthetase (AMP-forming)
MRVELLNVGYSILLLKQRKKLYKTVKLFKFQVEKLGQTTPIWDKIVFSKLNEKIFGGRVRTIVSGSAPLSTQVHEFLQM